MPEGEAVDVTEGAPEAAPPPARQCWGCGKAESGKPFQTCARCREDGLQPPAPFCSKECLQEHWPRHKAWHAERKLGGEIDKEKESAATKEKAAITTLKSVLKEQPASDVKSYMGLLMEADEVKLKGAYSKAEKLLRKAIDHQPQNPMAYAALGEIMGLTNRPQVAASQYVKAVELFPKKTAGNNPQGKNLWASSMLSAIFWLNVPGGKPDEQPSWFNDEELKELSAQLCEQAPQDLRSWQTRAFILCPMPDMPPQWRMPPGGMMRTEAELQEAGRCWQQVTNMTPGGREEKRPYVTRAAHCFRTAQMVAERVTQQAAAQAPTLKPVTNESAGGVTPETRNEEAMEKQMAALAAMQVQQRQQAEAVPAW